MKVPAHSSAIQAASPGRIEFIGNHTDYNGGQVLGVALNLQVSVTGIPRSDNLLYFTSEGMEHAYEGTLTEISPLKGEQAWANYPLGVIHVLREAGLPLLRGFNLAFSSDLPVGAGLSSSAAIELATLEAVCAIEGITLNRKEKVLLAQRAENTFVGVPCGILDQAVSCFGKKDHLVRIDCATLRFETVPLPPGLHFWIFNTHLKHGLIDSLYSTRHAECRQALSMVQKRRPDLEHLAHAGLEDLSCLDPVPVLRKRAEHVIREQGRVVACVEALETGDLKRVGDLLFESHESSRKLFENSIPELDTFVGLLSPLRNRGVIGARLSGGGFGGAVMALVDESFTEREAQSVIADYRRRHPQSPEPGCLHVLTGEGSRRIS